MHSLDALRETLGARDGETVYEAAERVVRERDEARVLFNHENGRLWATRRMLAAVASSDEALASLRSMRVEVDHKPVAHKFASSDENS